VINNPIIVGNLSLLNINNTITEVIKIIETFCSIAMSMFLPNKIIGMVNQVRLFYNLLTLIKDSIGMPSISERPALSIKTVTQVGSPPWSLMV